MKKESDADAKLLEECTFVKSSDLVPREIMTEQVRQILRASLCIEM